MSSDMQENVAETENLCVVCFKTVEIYSYGVCDHPVCFECSTRMRVLCKQNECPICRQQMPKVIFTRNVEPFNVIFPKFERSNLQDRKFGLVFCTLDIQKTYWKLLEHRCYVCDEEEEKKFPFRQFNQLRDHMRREHSLFYCELCTENLKIFTFERRVYNRQQLALHRRKGDPDNTSHRGHPLCEFCDTRFMDNDELFRHMRRNHMFCHFCDADGRHLYYPNLEELKHHFKQEHFFCEEGECVENPLVSVFRSDIDLKGHIAREHSRHMTKSAGKQARTLNVEFTLAPRPRNDNRSGGGGGSGRGRRDRLEDEDYLEPGGPGGGPNEPQFVNSLSSENFPTLGGSASVPQRPLTTVNFTSKFNKLSGAEFPSLGATMNRPSPAVTITTNSSGSRMNRPPDVTITRSVRGQPMKDQFPALAGPSSSGSTVRLSMNNPQDSSVSIQFNHKPNGAITTHITTSSQSQSKPTEAFPALGKAAPVSQPQPRWVLQKPKKQPQEMKNTKVAQAPVLPPSDLQQFPTLSSGKNSKTKKTSSVIVPVSQIWVNLKDVNSKPGASGDMKIIDKGKQKNDVETKTKNKKKKNKSAENENVNNNNNNNNNNESNVDKNGMVKKRSELKIGTLSLGESSQISTEFPTPNENKPPPGFSIKPPPGFDNSNFPTLGSNSLTFTNSTGQSYAITPNDDYRPPPHFNYRNQNLITSFKGVLNDSALNEFKNYSDLFRKNDMPAKNYYEHCKEILGSKFNDIFPELLALLPDIEKQQELYNIYEDKPKKVLQICLECNQVMLRKDLAEHYSHHTFGRAQKVAANAWNK